MTTDKTLADVQPGGRVRLATVPYDRARDLLGDAYNAGTHGIGYSQQAMELHDAIIPTQPSPGGQDALATLIDQWMARADRHEASALEADSIGGMQMAVAVHEARAAELNTAVNSLKEALAARQPVGEVSVKKEDANNYCLILRALGMEEEGDPVAEVKALIEARDRQPVGEPVAWMTHHDEPMLFPTAAEAAAYCEDDEQPVPLYAAPPAQAVDLGQSVGMAELDQILLDPENQPSQFGTVPTELLEKCEEMISDLVHQFGDHGCTCTFPEADCCAYARAEHYSRDGAAHG